MDGAKEVRESERAEAQPVKARPFITIIILTATTSRCRYCEILMCVLQSNALVRE